MPVGFVVVERGESTEFALFDPNGCRLFLGVVGSVREFDIPTHTFGNLFPGDDVDDTAHRIGPIEDGSWTTDHLNPFHVGGNITVGQWVAHQSHELRMTINQHQYTCGRISADATDCNLTRRSCGDTKAGYSSFGDKQTWYTSA